MLKVRPFLGEWPLFWELHRKPGRVTCTRPRAVVVRTCLLMGPSLLMIAKAASPLMVVKVPQLPAAAHVWPAWVSRKKLAPAALLDRWATSFAVALSSAQIEAALPCVQETFSEADLCRM